MNTLKSSLLPTALVAILSLAAGPGAYAQGTPDGETPANEGVCDPLMGSVPGLYGLCVAFCEAQDCEATFDEATGEVTFDPDCQPSSPKILDKYNERAGVDGPPMPCLNVAEGGCPCWTAAELEQVGDLVTLGCSVGPGGGALQGYDLSGSFEIAAVAPDQCDLRARFDGSGSNIIRSFSISPEEFGYCSDSIAAECTSRGF